MLILNRSAKVVAGADVKAKAKTNDYDEITPVGTAQLTLKS